MNPNHPDFKPPRIDPITYHLEEYEPAGMDGIFISDAWLDVGVDSDNEPVIHGIMFRAHNKPNCMIPAAFEAVLIKIISADQRIMSYIYEACEEEYANNH